jgi:hypothetical protein
VTGPRNYVLFRPISVDRARPQTHALCRIVPALELAVPVTPYTSFFGIHLTPRL